MAVDIENLMFNILFEYMLKEYHRVDINRSAVDMLLNINTEKYVKSFVDVLIQTNITPYDITYNTDYPPLIILHQLIDNDSGKKMDELLKTIYGIQYNDPFYEKIVVADFDDYFRNQNLSYETSMMYLTDIFLIALKHNTNVKSFTIFNGNLQYYEEPVFLGESEISSSLANVLVNNMTLRTLDISWLDINSISNIMFMFSGTKVHTLVMHSMFNIKDVSEEKDHNFRNLIDSLAGNTSITSLNLANNWIGDEELYEDPNAEHIKNLINHNKMIIDLNVDANGFSDKDVEEIHRAILQNRTLNKNLLFRLLENIVE